jgi:hypothetical protein
VVLDNSILGTASIPFSSSVELPAGEVTIANILASVPVDSGAALYGGSHVLSMSSVAVRDENNMAINATGDDALHVDTFFSDTTANGSINSSDAARIARVAALFESTFTALPLIDPMVVGDISGNGRLNAGDASLVARFAALFL